METHLIVRESETFYLKSTTTNLWGNNETIQISNREPRYKDSKSALTFDERSELLRHFEMYDEHIDQLHPLVESVQDKLLGID